MAVSFYWFLPQITRGPYLQQSSPTSVVIRWCTRWPARTTVRYGRSPSRLDRIQQSAMRGTDHGVLLADLQPGTEYYYSLSCFPRLQWWPSSIHRFVTPPPAGSEAFTRIWVLGDAGTRQHAQKAVRDAFYSFSSRRAADLCLMLGDNAYWDGSEQQYQKAVFDFYTDFLSHAPLWPTLGNHDARSADPLTQTGVYFDLFNLPAQAQCGGVPSGTEAYYSFDYANTHFVCLDSEGSDRSSQGPMLAWLKQDLEKNQLTWTVAFWHQPPYTKGSHDSDCGPVMGEMRAHVLPILEEFGVDLVLGGHSHNYERSYLLDGHYGTSETFSQTMIRARTDGRPDRTGPYRKPANPRAPHAGTVYVVAGSSGHPSHLGAVPHPAMCVSLNIAGSLVIDVTGPRLDAQFLDHAGQVRDRFAILKGNDL